jgi:hypothetical protein
MLRNLVLVLMIILCRIARAHPDFRPPFYPKQARLPRMQGAMVELFAHSTKRIRLAFAHHNPARKS